MWNGTWVWFHGTFFPLCHFSGHGGFPPDPGFGFAALAQRSIIIQARRAALGALGGVTRCSETQTEAYMLTWGPRDER